MRRAETILIALACAILLIARWRMRPRQPPMLRDAVNDVGGQDLAQRHASLAQEGEPACALCHVPHRGEGRKAAWSGGLSARMAAIASEAGVAAPAAEGAVPPVYTAPPSSVCLSCHDGTLGSGAGKYGAHSGGHPIGVDYRLAMMSDPDSYNPPDVAHEVYLDAGTVGCVSCHQVHGLPDSRSSAGVRRAACQACHRL